MGAKHWLLIVFAALANLTIVAVVLAAIADEPHRPPEAPYYVSLGDSYAQGFQLSGDLAHGFADQLVDLAAARGHHFNLVNYGCGGATVAGMLESPGCVFPAEDAPPYGDSQVAAAEAFLHAHPGQVELVTIVVGANDVSLCANTPDPFTCFEEVIADIGPRLTSLVERVRAAAGPDVPVVGLTYPNTVLGRWVRSPRDEAMARLSAEIYRQIFNPVLRAAYEKADATFVDVTEATGGYGPFDETTTVDPYGEIPRPVATVCELTNYCNAGDIHPNTDGYAVIAELVVATLPDRQG